MEGAVPGLALARRSSRGRDNFDNGRGAAVFTESSSSSYTRIEATGFSVDGLVAGAEKWTVLTWSLS